MWGTRSKGVSSSCCSAESGTHKAVVTLSGAIASLYADRHSMARWSFGISKSQTSSCLCKNTFLHHPMSLGSDSLEYSGQISSYQVLVLLLKLSNHFGYKQFGCTKLHPRLSSLWSLCGIWPREKLDLTNICGTIPNLYVVIHSYKGDGKQRFFCHSIISPI